MVIMMTPGGCSYSAPVLTSSCATRCNNQVCNSVQPLYSPLLMMMVMTMYDNVCMMVTMYSTMYKQLCNSMQSLYSPLPSRLYWQKYICSSSCKYFGRSNNAFEICECDYKYCALSLYSGENAGCQRQVSFE